MKKPSYNFLISFLQSVRILLYDKHATNDEKVAKISHIFEKFINDYLDTLKYYNSDLDL